MNGENWVLIALIAAWFIVTMTKIGVRHQQAKRRDHAKRTTAWRITELPGDVPAKESTP